MNTAALCFFQFNIITLSGILHLALNGNVLGAIQLIEQMSPDLLENDKSLLFDLLSLRFIELISSKKW